MQVMEVMMPARYTYLDLAECDHPDSPGLYWAAPCLTAQDAASFDPWAGFTAAGDKGDGGDAGDGGDDAGALHVPGPGGVRPPRQPRPVLGRALPHRAGRRQLRPVGRFHRGGG
mmetsp:Transcript_10045/g.24731  ORF Transcript_10045/g.24731 Transcript_10045/m.24731 type:complete len:114 (-) Transcript_10045:36-377(-)